MDGHEVDNEVSISQCFLRCDNVVKKSLTMLLKTVLTLLFKTLVTMSSKTCVTMLSKLMLKILLKIFVNMLLKTDVIMFLKTGVTMLLKTGVSKSFRQVHTGTCSRSGTGVHCRKACSSNGPRTNQPRADSPGAAAHLDLIQTSTRQTRRSRSTISARWTSTSSVAVVQHKLKNDLPTCACGGHCICSSCFTKHEPTLTPKHVTVSNSAEPGNAFICIRDYDDVHGLCHVDGVGFVVCNICLTHGPDHPSDPLSWAVDATFSTS